MPSASSTGSHLLAEDDAFRLEARAWLAAHLTDEYRGASRLSSVTDDCNFDVRLAWEKELAAGGWLGIRWPTEYGGRAGTLAQELAFLEEHARAGAPCWVGLQGRELFGPILLEHGTEKQKQRFLPPIMAAEEFWGQGFSEPDAGSDLANVRTRATRDGSEWAVDGQKTWTSFGAYADWIYAICRTDPASRRHDGLSLLLVPVDQPGVEIRPIRHMAGGWDFCEVFFSGAKTTADHVVGGVGNGWTVALSGLGTERFTTTLAYQSQFRRQYCDFLQEMRRRGATDDPVVRQRLSAAWIGLELLRIGDARMFTDLLGGQVGAESSLAKLRWVSWHQEFSCLMVDLLGATEMIVGDGYTLDPHQGAFLNARGESIYGGANEIQRSIVGERLLGLPR